jgi:hypothetical protein
MLFPLIVVAIAVWLAYGRPRRGCLPDFATLLDRPEFVDGFGNKRIGRAFLKGEFRGRNVVIMLQDWRGRYRVVLSMETHSAATMESYDFTGYRPDRETEMALFALEVKHDLRLMHRDATLKALWQPVAFFIFPNPGVFDPAKWQSVLEAMHTLAGSLERRAARSDPNMTEVANAR